MSNLSDYHLYLHPPKPDREGPVYCLRLNSEGCSFSDSQGVASTFALSKLAEGRGWPFTPDDESALTYLGTLDQFPELLL